MNKRISEIFDYGDEIVVVEEQDNPLDPARIKELTMKRIMNEDFREEAKRTVKKARPVYRTVLIAAAAAVLLIGTALAFAASGGFLQSVFGSKGWEDSPGMTYGDELLPAIEWAEADEQTAQAIVGEYVTSSGMSVQAGDYVFTVDDYLLDENSFGAVSYTLRRADGGAIPGYRLIDDGYSGQFMLDSEWLLSPITVYTDSETIIDRYNILDKDLTTDTELHGVLYIEGIAEIPEGDHIYLYMDIQEKTQREFSGEMQEGLTKVGQTEHIALSTDTRVPAQAYTDGEYTIWLTPISMILDAPQDLISPLLGAKNRAGEGCITIRYADGSEYVVISGEPYTKSIISGAYLLGRHSLYYIFNRFVYVENVVSVTIDSAGELSGTYMPDASIVRP